MNSLYPSRVMLTSSPTTFGRHGQLKSIYSRGRFFLPQILVCLLFVLGLNPAKGQTTTFSYSGSIVTYTVPSGVTSVTIEARGAQGGTGSVAGGLGADITGTFSVSPGQVLRVLVGGMGGAGTQGGGGGGSFVTDASNNPMCIAGGGGGGYYSTYSYGSGNMSGYAGNAGQAGIYGAGNTTGGAGGSGGGGGGCAPQFANPEASGGGGLTGSGSSCYGSVGGTAFTAGGAGGAADACAAAAGAGGFGGGGGSDWCYWTGGGGGGGYSGGGGGTYYGCGGGGGSYNGGTSQSNISGSNSGNGLVIITPVSTIPVPCTWSGPSNQQMSYGGLGAPPCGSNGSVSNVGSGTYTYLTLTGGHSYQFGTCGTSWNSDLTLWYYTGSGNGQGNNGGWAPVAWNEDNGPACTGTSASFNYDAYATSGNYILVLNQAQCGQFISGGSSAVLNYRENGLPSLSATPTNACVSPGCNGSVALSMGGSCQTHSLITGMYEQWNTPNTSIASATYNGRWTESGSINGNVDGSGQAYFTGNNNWTGGLWSTSTVTASEGLTLYGRWYNTGSYSMVGWHDNTAGTSYANLVYALYPYASGGLQIYESGNYMGDFTGTNASGIIGLNKWIEFKIVLHNQSSGNTGATYYIRNYTGNMSDPWQEIYQSTTSCAGQTLRAGAAIYSTANFYLDDVFMGGATQYPATSSLCAGSYTYAAQDQFGNVSTATAAVNNDALSSYGTLSNAGPVQYCDASGNFTTPISISGYTGSPTWYYGWSSCGVCSGGWVAGASSGTCCFPPKTAVSDGNADRVQVQVKNGQCPVVSSPVVLLQNKYNAAPTSLASSTSAYCSSSAPSTITLTATFPGATNILGNVEFATSYNGTPVATVAGNGTATVSATITAPAITTTYYVRYNPGSSTSGYTACSPTSSVSTTVTVTTLAVAPITGTTTICLGSSTTLSTNPSLPTGG